MSIESRNPATGELVESFRPLETAELERKVALAQQTAASWRKTGFAERAVLMRKAAGILRAEKEGFGALMALEMGKPVVEGEAEAEKCAWVCEHYAENAAAILAPETIATDAARSYVRFDPLGVVLAVMPWNFPFWQVFRFAAPALMAGNVGLLKHASNVPQCSLAIEEIFRKAGFPQGAFQSLLIPASAVEQVLAHPAVRAATLTGSEAAGSSLATTAGRLCKKTVLELGGSDPFIVLGDADPAGAASWAARARTINTGQSCIAAKRFIVLPEVADAFVEHLGRELEAIVVGDPMDRATRLGPLAREDLLHDLHRQVERSLAGGALLVTGGRRLERPGAFYAPTLLDRVTPGMPAFDEETFGPVAAVIRARDEAEAVRLANQCPYGLGASVWSGDPARAERLAPEIESGSVFINGMVKSDPRLPFGGIKLSGYGRELAGYGIKEFVNIKTVWVGAAPGASR
jgi:succinate-semialdehyde dehydrogenase / glutarate-semialdehyde dehydrogenase